MRTYAIAIDLPVSDLEKFDVVTVGEIPFQIVTEYYPSFEDGNGQVSVRPKKMVNGLVVESENFTQELADIIEAGRTNWNAANPDNLIPEEQELIWGVGSAFTQYKDPVSDIYSRTGDFVIVPADKYEINLETIVRDLGLTDAEDNLIARNFIWETDAEGNSIIPNLREFNEADGITTLSGWYKKKGLTSIFEDSEGNEYYVIEIKPLVDDLGERDLIYLLGKDQVAPRFTICRLASRVLHFVTSK